MRYASKVAMCRVQIPKLAYDNNTLEFWYTGNGSATFDPAITTGKATTIYWQTSDGTQATTTGTTHNFSYTPASGGPYRCTARVNGGLGLVTAIDFNADAVTSSKNIGKCGLTETRWQNNTAYAIELYEISNLPVVTILGYSSGCRGSVSQIPRTATNIQLNTCVKITGALSDLPSGALVVYLYYDSLISPTSIAHLISIRDIRIYSMWSAYTAADSVDIVINSMWAARAAYTYASGPSMQIGGANPDPTGNIAAPSEGADWHEDTPGHWVPLTPGAKIYDLLNDVNSEGFITWSSIAT